MGKGIFRCGSFFSFGAVRVVWRLSVVGFCVFSLLCFVLFVLVLVFALFCSFAAMVGSLLGALGYCVVPCCSFVVYGLCVLLLVAVLNKS